MMTYSVYLVKACGIIFSEHGYQLLFPAQYLYGLLGFDYAYGWDNQSKLNAGARWTEYANFNIVLGFEPE